MCTHRPSCPAADSAAAGFAAARSVVPHIVAAHPGQGWSLLCDGRIVFDDTGELLPDGRVVAPRRVTAGHLAVAA
ncbi:DUF5999 family protein [Streptomyces sp. NPDC017890]|uniref:DUF5999 family protein n=1 Tax=Streptomyces sp. NPDC017890 TaxID=3365015 RepID=UPI0037A38377